jgi:hypothetical protein
MAVVALGTVTGRALDVAHGLGRVSTSRGDRTSHRAIADLVRLPRNSGHVFMQQLG